MLSAGRLRNRITFQKFTDVQSDSGQTTRTWSKWKDWWAELVGQGGRELLQAQQVKGESVTLFRIRYCAGLSSSLHRVLFDGRIFDINNVTDPDGRKREHLVSCKEAVA